VDEDHDRNHELNLAKFGIGVLRAMTNLNRRIDAENPEVWKELQGDEMQQSGQGVQYLLDRLDVDPQSFMEFKDAYEEESGDMFHEWPFAWTQGRWDQFVEPWKTYAQKVLIKRGHKTPANRLNEKGIDEGDNLATFVGPNEDSTDAMDHRGAVTDSFYEDLARIKRLALSK